MNVLASAASRLSHRNFQRLADVIEGYCGIRMPPAKQTMVESRLRRRAKALGLDSLDEYCSLLFEQGGLQGELVALIDAITTNKTDFFREADHFSLLVERVLPMLLGRKDRPGLDRPLEVWSAACAIGAEPYTLAMVLDDFARRRQGFHFRILATDICTDALAKARLAVYPEAMAAPVPPEFRRRYVLRARAPDDATVRLIPPIRRMVHFGRLNLMDEIYPLDAVDIIFCRNILIYFERARQQTVLQRLCQYLRPGGFLFLGHNETVSGMNLPVTPVAAALFQRM